MSVESATLAVHHGPFDDSTNRNSMVHGLGRLDCEHRCLSIFVVDSVVWCRLRREQVWRRFVRMRVENSTCRQIRLRRSTIQLATDSTESAPKRKVLHVVGVDYYWCPCPCSRVALE